MQYYQIHTNIHIIFVCDSRSTQPSNLPASRNTVTILPTQKVIESRRTLTFEDNRFDYGEARFVTMGLLSDVVVLIVTTEIEREIRVISMRKADKHEQKIYFEHS